MKNDGIDWKISVLVFIVMLFGQNLLRSCGKTKVPINYSPYNAIRGREYSNRCECPYDIAEDHSICGDRSSYSNPGGREPNCYLGDIYGYPPQ
ncbi:hypothetical protein PQG02_14035 [Nostoc sp. UHCC 0926]|uniref:hypothetical protein n=1 Tax=unclassified Nostoc TaxID=2593658 RepID=UPI00235E5C47|nr:hypothetical protein [Nostoc sp. UHCC 0926]WDD35362.1 hypothetical protein PQG02_14035 [Nostoc sp. UHCC 0926]